MYIVAEYFWLDADNNFRSKVRVIPNFTGSYPEWTYDGSSTGQSTVEKSDIILRPVRGYPLKTDNLDIVLVLCETYYQDGTPLPNNNRVKAKYIFLQKKEYHPWFGLEQEYFIFKDGKPLGYEDNKEGIYYCGVGTQQGREFVEEHLSLCLKAGLMMSGFNAEVVAGQWEFQVGPVEGSYM